MIATIIRPATPQQRVVDAYLQLLQVIRPKPVIPEPRLPSPHS